MERGSSSHKKVELLSSDTRSILIQHTKRAVYQASHCWAQTMIATSELPSPREWGGTGMIMTAGKYAGQLFLKRHKLVVNYCAVAAIKVPY